MRRSTADNSIKGVTTLRNGRQYSVGLPRFSAPVGANSITIDRETLHEHFRKLTPKQRIAVLTIRDRNITRKLYAMSNVCETCNECPIVLIGSLVSSNA